MTLPFEMLQPGTAASPRLDMTDRPRKRSEFRQNDFSEVILSFAALPTLYVELPAPRQKSEEGW